MTVSFSRIIDSRLVTMDLEFKTHPNTTYIQTNRGRMLKIKVKECLPILHRLFEVSHTSEYMYIPMKYVKEIK